MGTKTHDPSPWEIVKYAAYGGAAYHAGPTNLSVEDYEVQVEQAINVVEGLLEQYENISIRADEWAMMLDECQDVNRDYAGRLEDALHERDRLKEQYAALDQKLTNEQLLLMRAENELESLKEQLEAMRRAAEWEQEHGGCFCRTCNELMPRANLTPQDEWLEQNCGLCGKPLDECEGGPIPHQALDIARKLVERDAETPDWRRRIEVGRGGLMLLATRLIDLEEQFEALDAAARRVGEAHRKIIVGVTPNHPESTFHDDEARDAAWSEWHASCRALRKVLGSNPASRPS